MSKRFMRIQVIPGKINPAQLQPLQEAGIDVNEVMKKLNEKLKLLQKYKISNIFVEIDYDIERKTFAIRFELPAVTELLLRLLGREEGPHQAYPKEVVGNLSIEDVAEVAYIKFEELRSRNFKNALKQVVSTCKTIGISIDGKDPKEVLKLIETGAYDTIIQKYEELLRKEELL